MNINKELLIQALELHLKGRPLDTESFNQIAEYAPLISQELLKAYDMNMGEFRQYLSAKKSIDFNDITNVSFNTRVGQWVRRQAKLRIPKVDPETLKLL